MKNSIVCPQDQKCYISIKIPQYYYNRVSDMVYYSVLHHWNHVLIHTWKLYKPNLLCSSIWVLFDHHTVFLLHFENICAFITFVLVSSLIQSKFCYKVNSSASVGKIRLQTYLTFYLLVFHYVVGNRNLHYWLLIEFFLILYYTYSCELNINAALCRDPGLKGYLSDVVQHD